MAPQLDCFFTKIIRSGLIFGRVRTKFCCSVNAPLGYIYTGQDRNRTGSASVYMEPFGTDPGVDMEPVRYGSKTGPANQQDQFWIRLDPSRTGSRTVPHKQKAYPV